MSPYQVGTVLLGKYRVDCVIGQGGMGLVLGATHVELDHRVAIKVLLPAVPGSEQMEARFLREAQAAASLRSENVVRVFDVGRLEDGSPYMVMEWLEGRDLSAGPLGAALALDEAVDYVVQACDAMIAAHQRNLVHRDLKPANLFLAHDEHGVPTIKVLDFGISKLRQEDKPNLALTDANGMMGSPLYMAPEQVKSARDVDARADIWSLGTILYELIAGEPPFGGETLGAVFLAAACEAPRALTVKRPEVPKGLEQVVLRCLEKEPAHRFQTAFELQRALLPFATIRSQARIAMRSSSAPPAIHLSQSGPPVAAARTTGGWADSAAKEDASGTRKGRSRAATVATVIGAVAVLGGGALFVLRHASAPSDAAALGASSGVTAATAPQPLAPATSSLSPEGPSPSSSTSKAAPQDTTQGVEVSPARQVTPATSPGTKVNEGASRASAATVQAGASRVVAKPGTATAASAAAPVQVAPAVGSPEALKPLPPQDPPKPPQAPPPTANSPTPTKSPPRNPLNIQFK